jgi:hypothetical protein
VDKWLRLDECPPQGKMAPRPGMAESFREELRQLWDQGCQNGKQLFAEMRQRGYIGSYTGLLRLLAEWRPEKTEYKSCPIQDEPEGMKVGHAGDC